MHLEPKIKLGYRIKFFGDSEASQKTYVLSTSSVKHSKSHGFDEKVKALCERASKLGCGPWEKNVSRFLRNRKEHGKKATFYGSDGRNFAKIVQLLNLRC